MLSRSGVPQADVGDMVGSDLATLVRKSYSDISDGQPLPTNISGGDGMAGQGGETNTNSRDHHSQYVSGYAESDTSSPVGSEWLSEGTRMVDGMKSQGAVAQEAALVVVPSADGLEGGRDVETELMMSPASRAQRASIAPLVNLQGVSISFYDAFSPGTCSLLGEHAPTMPLPPLFSIQCKRPVCDCCFGIGVWFVEHAWEEARTQRKRLETLSLRDTCPAAVKVLISVSYTACSRLIKFQDRITRMLFSPAIKDIGAT